MGGGDPEWSEAVSATYRDIAAVAVPRRAEQIAALTTLVPFAPGADFAIVELACGEGLLATALLERFSHARYLGFDGSDSMRALTAERLARFGGRARGTKVRIAPFDLAVADWRDEARGAGLVVSSLCVHHLDGAGKRALFADLYARLVPGGALLLADLVAPARPEAAAWFADSWDRAAGAQAQALRDGAEMRRRFDAERWNWYRHPDPADRPSGLFEQLQWLAAAGFAAVDCFWMNAGHAVYGGYKSPDRSTR